ncbi:hypothetical protein BH23ACT6_BH23ACT6_06230 [soil metagenome]
MAVTTVEIDKELLSEAKEALGEPTARATIDLALREVVMRRRQAAALDGLGSLDLDLHPTTMSYPDHGAGVGA